MKVERPFLSLSLLLYFYLAGIVARLSTERIVKLWVHSASQISCKSVRRMNATRRKLSSREANAASRARPSRINNKVKSALTFQPVVVFPNERLVSRARRCERERSSVHTCRRNGNMRGYHRVRRGDRLSPKTTRESSDARRYDDGHREGIFAKRRKLANVHHECRFRRVAAKARRVPFSKRRRAFSLFTRRDKGRAENTRGKRDDTSPLSANAVSSSVESGGSSLYLP